MRGCVWLPSMRLNTENVTLTTYISAYNVYIKSVLKQWYSQILPTIDRFVTVDFYAPFLKFPSSSCLHSSSPAFLISCISHLLHSSSLALLISCIPHLLYFSSPPHLLHSSSLALLISCTPHLLHSSSPALLISSSPALLMPTKVNLTIARCHCLMPLPDAWMPKTNGFPEVPAKVRFRGHNIYFYVTGRFNATKYTSITISATMCSLTPEEMILSSR